MSPEIATQRKRPMGVVIGSGFGGLAAAVRLGARGYQVTVLEQLSTAGGRAAIIEQDGFRFDCGPTIVTAPHLFEELWALCGRSLAEDVELRALSPYYRVRFDDGTELDWSGDETAMCELVRRLEPGDVAGYERLMRYSAQVYRTAFLDLAHVPFSSWPRMLRSVPALLRLRAYRSLHSVVAAHVRNPKLRFLLSFHPLFVGGNPFTTSALYGLILHLERTGGVHFAMGGTNALVRGLADLIRGQGGQLRFGAKVERILLQGRTAVGVQLASGEKIGAQVVVSNADTAWTYEHLLPSVLRRRWSDRRLARAQYSMSLFIWYFGTRTKYPEVPHHTILVGPRYRELLRDIFERHLLAADFSLYLHRPTATDASLAPPGCDAFYVLAPVPHLGADINWDITAEGYRERIAQQLEATLLPNLRQNVVTSLVMTPRDFQDRLLSRHGAAFGMQPLLSQSAWFRPHNQAEDFERLYLVGAGTHPGAGLPGVLSSARVLDALVPHADLVR